MSYLEDYRREFYKANLIRKEQELVSLENKFQENPSNELAKKIIENYHKFATLPSGWEHSNREFAYAKANTYQEYLNQNTN